MTDASVADPAGGLDIEALRAKYAAERARRINPRGNSQYVEVKGDFSRYNDDPYVDIPLVRDPVSEETEVVIVGGGFGGQLAAAKLIGAGIGNFRIVEKAGDFGGTWYWNRYPGAQCDIESYIYLPLLEETGYIPTEKYAYAAEIFAHAQRIGKHFGLYERALFQTQITDMRWDEDADRWIVTTDRGDSLRARFVISASGPINRPRLPGVPGIERYRGHSFHTSRWDYGYTGGNARGGMTKLADKTVAIIGTGATAIQCVPYVAEDAKHLYVVQRTPSTVDVRGNKPTDPAWARSLAPGWQKDRKENFNTIVSGRIADENLVQDGWTDIYDDLVISLIPRDGSRLEPEELARLTEIADFRKGNKVRARVDAMVTAPEAAEGLKAWYGMFCKRPTFNDEYLPAFNRANVTLIDTRGRGLDCFTEAGIVFDGVEYPVDCVIFATGFEVGTDYSRRAGYTIHGVGGETLAEHFADGPRSMHGHSVHGFPNFFMLGLGQNGFRPNITDMLDGQADHILYMIDKVREKGGTRIEATAGAEQAWVDTIVEKSQPSRAFLATCTPGYYGAEGELDKGLFAQIYGGGSIEYAELMEAWRAEGSLAGMKIG